MKVEVEMRAFAQGKIREVDIPDEEVAANPGERLLDRVFFWGQNDFQPKMMPSVSVGDVIRLNGKKYEVRDVGFCELKE